MSKYVIRWPQNHRVIKWVYYAEIRNELYDNPHRNSYASPSGTKVVMRSALISEAYQFDSYMDAEEMLWSKLGYDPTVEIRKLTEEDLEEAKKEKFNILLGNINGTSS